MDWIEQTFNKPDKIESDKKNDILEHSLKVIEEYYDRVLRLVCNTTEILILIVTIFFDSYKKNRITGSLILIDESTNNTVAAGMVH